MNINDILKGAPVTGLPKGHFIDGTFAKGESGTTMESFDPGRGTVFATFSAGGAADIDQAVTSANSAFKSWSRTPPAERATILLEAAKLLRAEAETFAIVETLDCGKPLNEALADVRGAARIFEYYAGAADKLQGDTFSLPSGYLGYSIYEPVGVTAQIIPWNFPISTAARGIAPRYPRAAPL